MIYKYSVDIDVVDTCNLSCKNCSRGSPYFSRNTYSFEEFEKDINELSKVLHLDFVHLCGGEPLLLGVKLTKYINTVRSSGITKKISVVTNGYFVKKFVSVLKDVDVVSVSLYPHKDKNTILKDLDGIQNELPCLTINHINEFQTLFTPHTLSESESLASWNKCTPKNNCNNVYKGVYYRCFGSARYHILLDSMGIPNTKHQGCPLHEPDLENRLLTYIHGTDKLSTCRNCLGGGHEFRWTQDKVKKLGI